MSCLLFHSVFAEDPYPNFPSLGTVTAAAFDRQLAWLTRFADVVPVTQREETVGLFRRPRVSLTFDDGFANFYDHAYPTLARRRVPATLFVSTAHLDGGATLWFSRLQIACLLGPATPLRLDGRQYPRATHADRERSLADLGVQLSALAWPAAKAFCDTLPDPRGLLAPAQFRALSAGLTSNELRELARDPLIEIGCHTVNHPFLSRCDTATVAREMTDARRHLEDIIRRPVTFFAYPAGDYDERSLDMARKLFQRAWAVAPRNRRPDGLFEAERVGIYGPSIARLFLKAAGTARVLRRMGRKTA